MLKKYIIVDKKYLQPHGADHIGYQFTIHDSIDNQYYDDFETAREIAQDNLVFEVQLRSYNENE